MGIDYKGQNAKLIVNGYLPLPYIIQKGKDSVVPFLLFLLALELLAMKICQENKTSEIICHMRLKLSIPVRPNQSVLVEFYPCCSVYIVL